MLAAQVGDEIGALMNAPPGSVACLQNVTTCQATVASCLDFSGRRNKVVYTDLNFPSVMYFWEAQRSRGARVEMVRNDDGIHVNTERLLDAIDDETLSFPSRMSSFAARSFRMSRPSSRRRTASARMCCWIRSRRPAPLPFDVQQLNVDFCTGGVLKWLCGGPGTAYLYVRPDLMKKLEPTFTGWIGHENPFGFEIGRDAVCAHHLSLHAGHAEYSCASRSRGRD